MERLVDPKNPKGNIGEFGGSKPQILSFARTQQEKAQSCTAGNEIDEQQNIRGKDRPESTPDLEGPPLVHQYVIPDANGCLGPSSQGARWCPRIYPDTEGDGERPACGGEIVGEGYELFASNSKTKCQPVFRRQSTKLTNQSAVGKYLIGPVDYGNEKRQWRVICGQEHLKAVP